jgi:predicted nucleotide-binding protein (sugar kinase/HSP70/actin superfamily)
MGRKAKDNIRAGIKKLSRNLAQIVREFDRLELVEMKKNLR